MRFEVILFDNGQLATISMSTADVNISLKSNGTLQVLTRLGNLSITDDSPALSKDPPMKHLLSIEGDEFAELQYETFDPTERTAHNGFNSVVKLRAGSLKFHFLERPLRDVFRFLSRLVRLKVLYDAAAQAAVQRASEVERMGFDVKIETPILIFPDDTTKSQDALTMRLGEVCASNKFVGDTSTIYSSLSGIQLASTTYIDGKPSDLKIIEDIEINAQIIQNSGIDRTQDLDSPDYKVSLLRILPCPNT